MSEYLGKTIGEFQLVETIDEGGASMVFKGFQPGMNRYVAVKMLKPSVARDPGAVQQFLQQGELMAQMEHPNILAVYTSGQVEGMVYRAIRLAESGSLRDHLSWFYNPNQALGLVDALVNALEFIHTQGYVHGNLKPSNVLLDAAQKPLLTDFGLPPKPGQPIAPYLAPEQVQGGVVDARADVYALGVLLFEVLTGQAPPPGVVVSPRARRPDLPEAVERVIFRAMAQNPEQRFQNVREMRNALEAALQAPVPPPQPMPQPTPQPSYTPTPSVSQTVTVEGQKGGPNWLPIILGILFVGALCLGAMLIVPRFLGAEETEPAGPPPTQPPPGVTVIVPTVVLPTREPRPTQPPEQPTEQPEQPTDEPPPIMPTNDAPTEQPPGQLPEEPGEPPSGGLPDICSSVGFVIGGIGLVGGVGLRKRRQLI